MKNSFLKKFILILNCYWAKNNCFLHSFQKKKLDYSPQKIIFFYPPENEFHLIT